MWDRKTIAGLLLGAFCISSIVLGRDDRPIRVRWMINADEAKMAKLTMRSTSPFEQNSLPEIRKGRTTIGMVAEQGERILGFYIYDLDSLFIRIKLLAAVEDRPDVPRLLIEHARRKLNSGRRTTLEVLVSEQSTEGWLPWLKKQAFRGTGLLTSEQVGEDHLVMAYDLPADLAWVETFSLYEILGVPEDADNETIEIFYQDRMRFYEGNEEAKNILRHAHRVLIDPARRNYYDETGPRTTQERTDIGSPEWVTEGPSVFDRVNDSFSLHQRLGVPENASLEVVDNAFLSLRSVGKISDEKWIAYHVLGDPALSDEYASFTRQTGSPEAALNKILLKADRMKSLHVDSADPYKSLAVSPVASPYEIDRAFAYQRLAFRGERLPQLQLERQHTRLKKTQLAVLAKFAVPVHNEDAKTYCYRTDEWAEHLWHESQLAEKHVESLWRLVKKAEDRIYTSQDWQVVTNHVHRMLVLYEGEADLIEFTDQIRDLLHHVNRRYWEQRQEEEKLSLGKVAKVAGFVAGLGAGSVGAAVLGYEAATYAAMHVGPSVSALVAAGTGGLLYLRRFLHSLPSQDDSNAHYIAELSDEVQGKGHHSCADELEDHGISHESEDG